MEFIGALKVKDGLFIGDEFSAQDLEFVVANKVTHIINCASKQVANHWEAIGVKYFPLYWQDSDTQVIVDKKAQIFNKIFDFIENTLNTGESVLVHSVRGQCRCICVVAAYLMRKYRWNLYKTLEFLNFRRPDMEVRQNFLSQLALLEKKYNKKGLITSSDWTETQGLTDEEHLLRNTYLNAQLGPIAEEINPLSKEKSFVVNWADNGEDDKEKLLDIIHPSAKNPIENGIVIIKSSLKGSAKEHRIPIGKPKKKVLNKFEEIFGNSTSNISKINKLNSDELIKLTESLEESLKDPKKVQRTPSKASMPSRSFSASSKRSKDKLSSKKNRPKTGASPSRSKRN
jgi:protein-tyrosine phosphatase